jgi:hypothetical protein
MLVFVLTNLRRGTPMKKVMLLTIFAALMMISSAAVAQTTASGTLTVTATVTGSISLVFNSDAAGVALSSGAGTNTATLAFGNVSAFGAVAAGVTRSVVAGTSFTVSTPVDVLVNKANTGSANYTLKAQLGSADAVNNWAVGGVAVTSAAQATITATGAYGSNVPEAVAITVPFTTTAGSPAASISNTINFVASAN